jgi:hypothetical protein
MKPGMKSEMTIPIFSAINKYRIIIGFAGIVCMALIFSRFKMSRDQEVYHIKKVLVINPRGLQKISAEEKNDLSSLKYSLFIGAVNFSETTVDGIDTLDLTRFDLLVLPYASAKSLSEQEVNLIKDAVYKGSYILLDGITRLAETLQINLLKKPIPVTRIQDLQFPENTLFWPDTVHVMPVNISHGNFQPLCVDSTTKHSVAVTGAYGNGKLIYFSPLFDPVTDKGYTRFPFLIEYLDKFFGIRALAERKSVEMYFDPGMREGLISTEALVKLWRQRNIKRIYAGGWYFDYGYDYEKLINECHANGILVYCWLETPMISIGFWKNHPEWREKTATLRDAYVDWRYLMNLYDEGCRKEAFKFMDTMLLSHDWDGVNLAELYFEPSPVGPELPENFTPMNDIVRKEFKDIHGFDPILIFDTLSSHFWENDSVSWHQFADYRKDLCYRLKQNFLDFLTAIQHKNENLEVMLTVIDVSLTPIISDNIGEDTRNAISLYQKYGITMQIEDPSSCWGLTPERYDKLGKLYRQYIGDKNRLVFDCNVVNAHESGFGGFPAEKPTGEEIRQIAYNMAVSESRPTFYSEDVVNENDFRNINTVLAHKAQIIAESDKKWFISTPYTVSVHIGNPEVTVKLDGKNWMARDKESIIIPTGDHTLEFGTDPFPQDAARLKSISGELNTAKFNRNHIEFSYQEDLNSCFVITSQQPKTIVVDDIKCNCRIYRMDSSEYTIKLPRGIHTVNIGL